MSESHLRYGCQIWGQRSYHKLSHIANLQGKGNRIISFQKVINTCLTKIVTLNETMKSEDFFGLTLK